MGKGVTKEHSSISVSGEGFHLVQPLPCGILSLSSRASPGFLPGCCILLLLCHDKPGVGRL